MLTDKYHLFRANTHQLLPFCRAHESKSFNQNGKKSKHMTTVTIVHACNSIILTKFMTLMSVYTNILFCSIWPTTSHSYDFKNNTREKNHVKANSQQLVTFHFPLIQRSNHCPCTLVVRSLRPRYEKPPEQKVGRLMLWYDISEWISYQITPSHKSKRKTRCSISFKWQTWHENSKSEEWFNASSSDETIEGWD